MRQCNVDVCVYNVGVCVYNMGVCVYNTGFEIVVARGYQNCRRSTTIGDSSSLVVYHRIWVTDGLIISAGQVSEPTQWLPLG